jgi:sec-independent protein translocase protein TatB
MLSVPHMIVVFVIVLVVFGPQKLPELARGLGKLMAEFRKASTDFKSAFEEEMRDIERQAREVERRKAEAAASPGVQAQPATLTTPGAETPLGGAEVAGSAVADATGGPGGAGGTELTAAEAPVVAPVAEGIVARDTWPEVTAARPEKAEGADAQEAQRANADH